MVKDWNWVLVLGCCAIGAGLAACGSSAVMSGMAVGKVGSGLSSHGGDVPQGAEVCALQEGLKATTGQEKALTDVCGKALKSDRLWRGAMLALSAHAEKLTVMSSGSGVERAGQLEAALTGISGSDWAEADGSQEEAAKNAATQLVNQMGAVEPKRDLKTTIKDAAPHVKVLCEGIGGYLDAQLKTLADVEKEIDKRRTTHADRRCGNLDNRTVCVAESGLDKMAYANLFGRVSVLQDSHVEARNELSEFCAAHRKLEEAAAAGNLSSDKTYGEIVDAVKKAPRAKRELPSKPEPAKPAGPEKK